MTQRQLQEIMMFFDIIHRVLRWPAADCTIGFSDGTHENSSVAAMGRVDLALVDGLWRDTQQMKAHARMVQEQAFEPAALRDIFGHFATGVTVATTLGDNGAPVGLAANSFASVSLDPPLIVWSISLQSPSLGAFRHHGFFAINIMCDQSKDLALNFARPSEDKFAGIDWRPGLNGVPVIEQASAVIQCRTETRMAGGDHEIYLGHVLDFHQTDKSPLLFHKGEFAALGDKV